MAAPDQGRAKLNQAMANELGLPFASIFKKRLGHDEKAEAVEAIGNVSGKEVIIFDDEIKSFSTMDEAIKLLLNEGAVKVYGCGFHPVLSDKEAYNRVGRSDITELMVMNTLPLKFTNPKIKTIDISPLFAEAIKRAYLGQSISEIF